MALEIMSQTNDRTFRRNLAVSTVYRHSRWEIMNRTDFSIGLDLVGSIDNRRVVIRAVYTVLHHTVREKGVGGTSIKLLACDPLLCPIEPLLIIPLCELVG